MPKGRKTHAHPESMTLTAQCQCGKVFEGLAAQTNRLFFLHRKKCPQAAEKGEIVVAAAQVDSFGKIIPTAPKHQAELDRAVEPYAQAKKDLSAYSGGRIRTTLQEVLEELG